VHTPAPDAARAAKAEIERNLAAARQQYRDTLGHDVDARVSSTSSDSHSLAARKRIVQLRADLVEAEAILEALEADAAIEAAGLTADSEVAK
jgi:enamine deaminase RidA (YjgF/YER057c/UK114 family)